MTNDEMDLRVLSLNDDDLRQLARGGQTADRVECYRPSALLQRLASDVLRLRADLAAARAVVESLAERCAAQSAALSRRAEKEQQS